MNLKTLAGFLPVILVAATVKAQISNEYYLGDFWSGEYPTPVIKVTAATKVKALKEIPFGSRPHVIPVSCTLNKGVYHPWARKTKAAYYSVTGITVHEAKVATTIELDQARGMTKVSLNPGEVVRQLAYHGEGYCLVEVKGLKGVAFCLDEKEFKILISNDYYHQYLKASCQEGYQAYISVTDDIFTIKGIESGNITDYGHVEE
jgi:hypothetical protein